jgi:hypothetical protein
MDTSGYVRIRKHTSGYVRIRQHSIRQHTSACEADDSQGRASRASPVPLYQHTPAYVISSAYVSIRLTTGKGKPAEPRLSHISRAVGARKYETGGLAGDAPRVGVRGIGVVVLRVKTASGDDALSVMLTRSTMPRGMTFHTPHNESHLPRACVQHPCKATAQCSGTHMSGCSA